MIKKKMFLEFLVFVLLLKCIVKKIINNYLKTPIVE